MDFRQRLEQGRNKASSADLYSESDEGYECQYFSADRVKSPACFELRFSAGVRKAIPYAYVTEINFDVELGIEIFTTQKHVRITGRNLSKIFDYLVSYRVRFIQANIGMDVLEDGLFVKEIVIENLI